MASMNHLCCELISDSESEKGKSKYWMCFEKMLNVMTHFKFAKIVCYYVAKILLNYFYNVMLLLLHLFATMLLYLINNVVAPVR